MSGPKAADQDIVGVLEGAFVDAPVPVVSAYLFGSIAEGRAHTESDVDVGVLLPRLIPGAGPASARERFEERVRAGS